MTAPLTDAQAEKLREAAESVKFDNGSLGPEWHSAKAMRNRGYHPTDAAYIALANPATILALLDEREGLKRSLLTVQNAAKTLAKAQDAELQHRRENAAYDHRIRAEHESLQERDGMMTVALLAAEAQRDALRAERDALAERSEGWAVSFAEKCNEVEAAKSIIRDCLKELDRSQRPSYAWQLRARSALTTKGISE